MLRQNWPFLTFLLFLLGVALNQRALLSLAVLVATIMVVATLWNRYALRRLDYSRIFGEERLFVGENVPLTIELYNNKLLPLSWIQVEDRFPEKMPPTGRQLLPAGVPGYELLTNVGALGWFEKVRWHYEWPCTQRGFFFFGPVTVKSGDIFGIFEDEAVVVGRTRLIVYPQVHPLERLGLPAKNPFGPTTTKIPVYEDPTRVVGVRDYTPDDPMRRIHWKATARTQELQVRVWEPTQERQVMLLMNVSSFANQWQGVNRELLEWTISIVASLCYHAIEERNAVGLVANASVPQSDQPIKVPVSRSPHQMRYLLEALAAVTPFATGPIEEVLRKESPKIGWGVTLVIVTAVVSTTLLAQMARLRRAGRPLVLISLDEQFDEGAAALLRAQGLIVYQLPPRPLVQTPSVTATPVAEAIEDSHAAFRRPTGVAP